MVSTVHPCNLNLHISILFVDPGCITTCFILYCTYHSIAQNLEGEIGCMRQKVESAGHQV